MSYRCTEDRFLKDTANHEMTVIRDDGISRHLRFKHPDTISYFFDLITWKGHLCIAGDCGTYVFGRIEDMFQFFRQPKRVDGLYVNPGYWGEKLKSVATNGGYKEFDPEAFKESVKWHYTQYLDGEDLDSLPELWEEIESRVLSQACDGDHSAYRAVYEFEWTDSIHREFSFADFFDGGGTERHTFQFMWCLYAIVRGIQMYDAQREVTP